MINPFIKYGRVCYIEVATLGSFSDYMKSGTNGCEWERIDGLDVKFDIQHPIMSMESTANISILGLSRDKIERIATYGEESTILNRMSLIRVYAGYTNGNGSDSVDMIFEGVIIRAMPTLPPDIWLEITAKSYYALRYQRFTVDFSSASAEGRQVVTLREYIKVMCGAVGDDNPSIAKSIDGVDKLEVTLPVYDKPVSLSDISKDISAVCSNFKIAYYVDYQSGGKPHFKFMPKSFKRDEINEEDLIVISAETGMIGIPKLDYMGATVTTFLSNASKDLRLDMVKIISRMGFPGRLATDINGRNATQVYMENYMVLEIRYHGHLRGNEWYVTYKTMRDFTE